uniref:Methyltransferase HEMK2 n=1 Tax=Ciona savignyi TaxID=51511 RepID=H2YG33_CIOSA
FAWLRHFKKSMEIPTPIYNHVSNYDVYEPAEDTFLLLDALEKEQDYLKALRPTIALEVGCGSGVVSAFLATILGDSTAYFCTDRNQSAASCCVETSAANHVTINPVLTDLSTSFLPRFEHSVDVLIFNPPYVVTPPHEVEVNGITASWAGGVDGRQVMNRFFKQVPNLLSNRGVLYLVVIRENKPDEIREIFNEMGFLCEVVMTRRSGPEFLMILKFVRK